MAPEVVVNITQNPLLLMNGLQHHGAGNQTVTLPEEGQTVLL